MSKPKLIIVDAGHGGLDLSGKYTTKGKFFRHQDRPNRFHGKGYFYEGVSNRKIAQKFIFRMEAAGIPYVKTYHEYEDTHLLKRVKIADYYSRHYDCFLISLHSNSSVSHRGRGMEVYTTRGHDASDPLAQNYYNHCKDLFGDEIIYRPDRWSEKRPYKDDDKEADFYIIKAVSFPAILTENLFFDQYDDAVLLSQDHVQEFFAEASFRTALDFYHA